MLGLLAACSRPDSAPAGNADTASNQGNAGNAATAAGTTVASTPDSTGTMASREIYIDSVTASNPVVIHGRARTFENTVQARVRDASGELMTETFTTSDGEMGHHNSFVVRAWLTRPPGDRIIVESFEYSAKDGSVRSLIGDTVYYRTPNTTVTLHWPTSQCTTTKPQTRELPRSVGIARLLVEALVAGPDARERAAGATAVFPRGSALRGVNLRNGVLTVDFNERLQNVGGSCAAQAIRASVTETLRRVPGVQRVVITAGGSADLALQP